MSIWLIIQILTVVLSLVVLILGMYIVMRCAGKMKMVALSILFAVAVLFLKMILSITMPSNFGNTLSYMEDFALAILFLIAGLSMKGVIKKIDSREHLKSQ